MKTLIAGIKPGPLQKTMEAAMRAGNANLSKMCNRMANLVFRESPLFRYLYRCGRARRNMRKYRQIKNSRRPQRFRQNVW